MKFADPNQDGVITVGEGGEQAEAVANLGLLDRGLGYTDSPDLYVNDGRVDVYEAIHQANALEEQYDDDMKRHKREMNQNSQCLSEYEDLMKTMAEENRLSEFLEHHDVFQEDANDRLTASALDLKAATTNAIRALDLTIDVNRILRN